MNGEDVHFHMLKLFSFPLTAKESGRTVLHETRLAFAETRDIRGDEIFGANPFPWFTGTGCCEGSLALDTSGEGLLFHEEGGGRRTAGNGGHGEIKELMGGHAELFAVGRTVWREARLELHNGRVWDGGGMGRCGEGII